MKESRNSLSSVNGTNNSFIRCGTKEINTTNSNQSLTTKKQNFKADVEVRILEKFTMLNDPKFLRSHYCSYDFHPTENYMLDFWKDFLRFLFEDAFKSFSGRLDEIYDFSKLKGKRPLGLENILKQFINDNLYVVETDLLSDEYFKKHHPELFQKDSFFSSISKSAYSYFSSFFAAKKEVKLNEESYLINIYLLKLHCNELMGAIKTVAIELDTNVITVDELYQRLTFEITEKDLETCLKYMDKLKRIIYFITKLDTKDLKCIKYLTGDQVKNPRLEDKDTAIILLQHNIEKLEKRENEMQEVIANCTQKIKESLTKNNREKAKTILRSRKLYEAKYAEYCNMRLTLEQNLLDIKASEGNQLTKNTLLESIKTMKDLQINNKEFDDLFDRMRNNREDLQDLKASVTEYNNEDINDEEIEGEILVLQKSLEGAGSGRGSGMGMNSRDKILANKENLVFEFPKVKNNEKTKVSTNQQNEIKNPPKKQILQAQLNHSKDNKEINSENVDLERLLEELNR